MAARNSLLVLSRQALPAASAFRVGRLLSELKHTCVEGEKAFNALVVKYGVLRQTTHEERHTGMPDTVHQVIPENATVFNAERDALFTVPVSLACGPLTLSLPGFDTLFLSASDIVPLMDAGLLVENKDDSTI